MVLTVNGEKHAGWTPVALKQLLARLRVHPRRAAVVVNDEVIPRAKHGQVVLKDGDRVEILTLAVGG